jgi:hypothetical protein
VGFRSEDEAQRAKLDALQRRVAELEEKLEENRSTPVQEAEPPEGDADPSDDATKPTKPTKPKSYEQAPLLARWLVVAVILAGGPAIRGCASEPMALPALRVACPTAETLSADVRSGGMVPSSRGGYSETLDVAWRCDGANAGVPRSIAGSAGWGLGAAALFLFLAGGMLLLPRAAWPVPALLAPIAAAGHAWWSWQIAEPVGTWAAAGMGSLMTWGLLLVAGASASACTDLSGPDGDDPSVGYVLGTAMVTVGVFGSVPVFNVFLAVAAFVFALMHTTRPLPVRIATALVAPALVAIPWGL